MSPTEAEAGAGVPEPEPEPEPEPDSEPEPEPDSAPELQLQLEKKQQPLAAGDAAGASADTGEAVDSGAPVGDTLVSHPARCGDGSGGGAGAGGSGSDDVLVAKYIRDGISAAGLRHVVALFAKNLLEDATTSDLCQAYLKPRTVPAGWADEAELIDPANRWYKHAYRCVETGEAQSAPPSTGTRSFCRLLAAEPATACGGRRTSWATTGARASATSRRPCPRSPRSSQRMSRRPSSVRPVCLLSRLLPAASCPRLPFTGTYADRALCCCLSGFDCFSLDQHSQAAQGSEWWTGTFMHSIRSIGRTVMLLSPWDVPTPLTRAWRLCELYCTVEAGAAFSVCLGPNEPAAFEAAVFPDDGFQQIMGAFAAIDVSAAQAGSPDDLAMILGAAVQAERRLRGLDTVATVALRSWLLAEVPRMARARADTGGVEAVQHAGNAASALYSLGALEAALKLYEVAAAGFTAVGDAAGAAGALENGGSALQWQGRDAEARPRFEAAVAAMTERYGPAHESTLLARLTLGGCMRNQGEHGAACV